MVNSAYKVRKPGDAINSVALTNFPFVMLQKTAQLIREAFKQDDSRDLTAISLNKGIFLLSLPMVIEMSFEALFALVDAFFVARYVGINGVAAVGFTESVLTLIYSIAWGLSAAATAIIARRIGEKNKKEGGIALSQMIIISMILGSIVGVVGYLNSEEILELMGAEAAVISSGVSYTQIQFISTPIIILLFTLSGALRGAGNANTAMKSVIIANVLNILLDYIFVPVLGMGIAGAAYATLIGRSIGVIYQLNALINAKQKIQLLLSYFTPHWKVIKNILKIAAGSTGQFLIQSASWVFLVRILAIYGSEVIAGYTIALRVIIFTILPSWGLANAAATLVGQNLGANKPQRAIDSTWKIAYLNMAFLGLIAIFFFAFSQQIIGYFDPTLSVVKTGSQCLKILGAGYILFGLGMVITQAINGAGDTLPPTVINIICFWIIEIPLAYYLGEVAGYEESGVFFSIIISETMLAILAVWYFKTNRWQKASV